MVFLLKYDLASQKTGDFYAHAGVFLVNEKEASMPYVGEFGMMRIANSNFYTKYSIIDWDTKDDTHAGQPFEGSLKIILSLSFPSSFLAIAGPR